MLKSYDLRYYVLIQSPTVTLSDSNTPSESFSTTGAAWCKIETTSGESEQAAGVTASYTHKITMRYQTGVTHRDQFLHEGRSLGIVKIEPNESAREIVFYCNEIEGN